MRSCELYTDYSTKAKGIKSISGAVYYWFKVIWKASCAIKIVVNITIKHQPVKKSYK